MFIDSTTMTTAATRAACARAVSRLSDRPVVAAGSVPGYGPIFNAGLVEHDGRFHLFARAVRDTYRRNEDGNNPRFLDYVSDIAVFESADGIEWDFAYILARAGDHGVDCFEDPRVQVIHSGGVDHFVMTYTNLPSSGEPWRVGAHRLRHDGVRFHVDADSGRVLGPDGVHDKDAVVFNLADGSVGLVHRIHPDMQLAVFDDLEQLWDADARYWDGHVAELDRHTIIRPTPGALGIGAGAPPIVVDEGLLLFFHERRADGAYTTNVALLDRTSGHPLSVLPHAVMQPELPWELEGDVDRVVFVQGAHLLPDGDTVFLVYGAADRHIGAATASVRQLLELLDVAAGH